MPSRNIVKPFVSESYYHLYNRGVEKRLIFLDDIDYRIFLNLLKRHLNPALTRDRYNRPYKNLSSDINLIAYCLMPNHFHLMVYQSNPSGITNLMRCVITAYSMSFNTRHGRVGSLFQDNYKAALIQDPSHLQHLSRYIHLNPLEISKSPKLYPYSSYSYYLGQTPPDWLRVDLGLEVFDKMNPKLYHDFMKGYDSNSCEILGELALDEDFARMNLARVSS